MGKKLLCGAVIAFSMSTVISATTSSFAVMLLMRFFLGALISATEPVGFSMLRDLFPRTVRTASNSIVGTGSYEIQKMIIRGLTGEEIFVQISWSSLKIKYPNRVLRPAMTVFPRNDMNDPTP
jgi:sugar phosphate permease